MPIWHFLALMIISVFLCFPAYAAGLDFKKINEVKPFDKPADFDATTKKVSEESPYGIESLSYEVRLPATWTENINKPTNLSGTDAKGILQSNFLTILGRYMGKPKNLLRSSFVVEAQGLPYEVSAKHWFVNYALSKGYTISAMTVKSEQEVTALYVTVENDQSYAVLAKVLFSGKNALMARYFLPVENYEDEKQIQWTVMDSFRLKYPSDEKIEERKTHGFLDQSFFDYPESWDLKENSILTIERMHVVLSQTKEIEETKVLEGYIRVNAVSRLLKTTLQNEVALFRKNLSIPGYTLGGMIENLTYTHHPEILSGKAQIYALVPEDKVNDISFEFAAAILEGKDYFYIISMVSPSRENDFFKWARNMESYRIVVESMRRFKDNLAPAKVDTNDPYYEYLKEYEADKAAQTP